MKVRFNLALFAGLGLVETVISHSCFTNWKCLPTKTAPTIDADFRDWDGMEFISTKLIQALTGKEYDAGHGIYMCMYDTDNIYIALQIPGEFRYNATDNHLSPAVGLMFKMGSKATYVNMGGCPETMGGNNCSAIPDSCADYMVDLGESYVIFFGIDGHEYQAM